MPNKMLIDATHPEETRVVVVRGNRVEEFDFETAQRKQLRGNIYLAKVTRVEPSLQAAFIEYGGNRHGFLAFSEIHPDYYQIPVADRQALIEADERAHREAEEETDNRSSRGKRPRHRNSRRRGHGDRVQSAPVADAGDGAQPAAHDVDHAVQTEQVHDDHAPAHHEHDHAAESQAAEQQQVHAGDHEETAAPADVAAAERAPDAAALAEPAAVIEPPESPLSAAQHANIPAESDAPAPDHTAETPHDDHHDDAHHDDAHHDLAAAHADDGEAHAPAAHDEAAADDEDEDDDDAEEDVVESVGGDDVLEEVPERAFRPRRQYKIQEVIKRRQVMLVQVVKEERGNKGAALTTYLSLAGRYAVLMPNTARGGGISRKITSAQDRSRLKEVVQDLDVPEGMGIILRTAGAARTKPEIKRDFEYLIRMWETVRDMTLRSQAPTLVYEEGSLIKRSLRDLYNKEIDDIQVAGDAGYQEARDFMKMLMPSNVRAVKPYRDTQPLFSKMGVESQLDAMFTPTVQLRSGGYIVINQTEALVSIDVNSGRSTREHHIEDTALKTNLEAAEEVARQLRLRDLAGLIVIDFIDMDEKRNNRAVERKMSDCLRQDRARIQVGRISHFGLLEMSRQRIRASVLESSTEPCPHCGGTGHVRSVSSVALQLLRGVEEILMKGATHNLTVRTRTDVALYVLNHKRGHLRDLEDGFQVTIAVIADATVHGQQAFFIDRGEQIHTLEAAKAILAAQVAANPAYVEEPFEEDEAFETEAEVETEETEGLADEAAAAEGDDTDGDSRKRKRRRRRRGRSGEGRDDNRATDDGEAPLAPSANPDTGEPASADAEGDDDAEDAGESRADGSANGERRPRRRGRRGGRRRRGGTEDGLVGSIADELGPTPPSEVASAATALDETVTADQPASDQATSEHGTSDHGISDQPWIDDTAAPVAAPAPADRRHQPAPRAETEALHERSPAAPAPADADSDKASRRRSTVREKVGFATTPAAATATAAPVEAAPQPTAQAPDPAAQPAATATPAAAEPRKAGWWRRFSGGE